jgi:hypothetical protein
LQLCCTNTAVIQFARQSRLETFLLPMINQIGQLNHTR